MGRGAVGVVVAVIALGAAAPAWAAPQFPTGWDGSNPFRCELQQAGFGTVVADPGADPYCVEFDKRRQNLDHLGLVEFLVAEPARVAAALPVCFYFQSDRWRGSIVQEDASTKTYEFDGHYFFDRARGEGGVWVTNMNVAGETFDASAIPGIPAEFARVLGPGTGGMITRNDLEVEPRCVERARDASRPVYASPPAGADEVGAGVPGAPDPVAPCPALRGAVSGRALGPIRMGDPEERVRAALGRPARVHRGFLRFCVAGGGKFLVGQRGDRSGDAGSDPATPTAIVLTTSGAVRIRGVGSGSTSRAVRRAFPRAHRRFAMGRTVVFETSRGSGVVLGVRDGRVRYLAVRNRSLVRTAAGLRSFLRRAQ